MSEPPTSSRLLQLSTAAGRRLATAGLTIAFAESCTAGLLASTLTDVAGSSVYVLGGVVSYSNEAKTHVLGVPKNTLASHGAVSAETAAAMAAGARTLFNSDLAVAVTGIAGPGGGTPEKPVGLVYLHLAGADAGWGEQHFWPYDRIGNKLASVEAALSMLIGYFEGQRSEDGGQRTEDRGRRTEDGAQRPKMLDRPVVVEGHWRAGRWRLDAVWLEGQRQEISGVGRQSEKEDGTTIVMAEMANGARLELAVDVRAGGWRLQRAWWPTGPLA
jgi:nicotinamide-nucleotide amidase